MTHDASIWITGVGAVTPLGTSFEEISSKLLRGTSAIREVVGFDVSQHPCRIAGQVGQIECPPELGNDSTFAQCSPMEQAALWSSARALTDAGLWHERQGLRIGLLVGLGTEWIHRWNRDWERGGTMLYDPTVEHEPIVERMRDRLGLSGPTVALAAACASGNHAFAQARRWLRRGWVDVCLAGAADMSIDGRSLATFGNLRALSRNNDQPAAALRPFDRDRDGMVLGEGGAVFVLECEADARRRHARPLGEVAGVGCTSDAHHLVIPASEPVQAAEALRRALDEARVNPQDVDYVNAHATGTPVGDVCEARMLQTVFGSHCPRLPVSASKSMTGHLIGAAAAVEALACLTAIRYGAIPPTLNLEHPDPRCELDHVARQARECRVRVAVSNSFGFGGHNTSLVLKQVAA